MDKDSPTSIAQVLYDIGGPSIFVKDKNTAWGLKVLIAEGLFDPKTESKNFLTELTPSEQKKFVRERMKQVQLPLI